MKFNCWKCFSEKPGLLWSCAAIQKRKLFP